MFWIVAKPVKNARNQLNIFVLIQIVSRGISVFFLNRTKLFCGKYRVVKKKKEKILFLSTPEGNRPYEFFGKDNC